MSNDEVFGSFITQIIANRYAGKRLIREKRSRPSTQTKETLPTINPGLSRKLTQLERPLPRLLTGAITGHAQLNKYLFNLGVKDSPICRACKGEEEIAAHVIKARPGVAKYRARHFVKGLVGFLEELSYYE